MRRFGWEGQTRPLGPGHPERAGAKGNARSRGSRARPPGAHPQARPHGKVCAAAHAASARPAGPVGQRWRGPSAERSARARPRASGQSWRGGASAGRRAPSRLPAPAWPRRGVPAPRLPKSEVWGITEPIRPAARAGALRPRARARARGGAAACEGAGGGRGSACEGAGAGCARARRSERRARARARGGRARAHSLRDPGGRARGARGELCSFTCRGGAGLAGRRRRRGRPANHLGA